MTDWIDKCPGFPTGVKGSELADNIRAQVERFDVEILQAQAVSHIMAHGDHRLVAIGQVTSIARKRLSWLLGPLTGVWASRGERKT